MVSAMDKLIVPKELTKTELAIEMCEEIIRDALIDHALVQNGERVRKPSFVGEEYDEGYLHARKDTARIILITLGITDLGPNSDNPTDTWENER